MVDENQTPGPEQGESGKASVVITEALLSMRENEKARALVDALENAWHPDSGKFDVEAAVRGIEAGLGEKGDKPQ